MTENPDLPNKLLMSDEAHFHLHDTVQYSPYRLTCTQKNIREELAKISEETLQAVTCSYLTRVHLCIEEGGGHLKDTVHKK
jgi:hypothetical protein